MKLVLCCCYYNTLPLEGAQRSAVTRERCEKVKEKKNKSSGIKLCPLIFTSIGYNTTIGPLLTSCCRCSCCFSASFVITSS